MALLTGYKQDDMKRHTFDLNSFYFYSKNLIKISFSVLVILAMGLAVLGSQINMYLWLPGFWLPAVTVMCLAFIFFSQLFVIKKSEVLTAPGLVIYRRRRLFPGPERVFFIAYYIKSVTALSGSSKRYGLDFQSVYRSPYVRGDIEAVYFYKDGKGVYKSKCLKSIFIPSCFSQMPAIYETLNTMQEQGTVYMP